jgi:glycosyltransferase involved in cell wall biosynthesis
MVDSAERYTSNVFINTPPNRTNIEVVRDTCISDELPFFSIVVPVYNQERIIINNLNSIIENTTEKRFELIIIIDACSDTSEARIREWSAQSPLLVRLLVLKSTAPLFETSADNLGFYHSRGEYFLEIQADMCITEQGYNMKLLQPFLMDPTILGISGRYCCNFTHSVGYGKPGRSVLRTNAELGLDDTYYYINNTCIRGPLLLHGAKLKELGYLDEVNYFLDDSDHDLFARAYLQKGWICGYVPVDVTSPLEDGSTRKPRDSINRNAYNERVATTQRGVNGFLNKNRHLLINTEVQRYPLR